MVLVLGYYNRVPREVAKIAGFHGVKGEIKFYPLIDDLEIFHELEEVLIAAKTYKISSTRPHKNWILVKFEGYDDLNSVENLRGIVEAEIEEDLEEGSWYIADLIGLKVLDATGQELGLVQDYSSQAQDHIFIKLNDSFKAKRELILPFVDEYILDVQPGEFVKVKLDQDLLELSQ